MPVLVDHPPQVVLLAVDLREDLVEVPHVARLGPAPPAHRLVRHDHAALGEQFLHVAVAQRKAAGYPHRVADDRGREALRLVVGGGRLLIHTPE